MSRQIILSKTEWEEIRQLAFAGMSYQEISRQFGIKESTIRSRANRERWTRREICVKAKKLFDESDIAKATAVNLTQHIYQLQEYRLEHTDRFVSNVRRLMNLLDREIALLEDLVSQNDKTAVKQLEALVAINSNLAKDLILHGDPKDTDKTETSNNYTLIISNEDKACLPKV